MRRPGREILPLSTLLSVDTQLISGSKRTASIYYDRSEPGGDYHPLKYAFKDF